MPIVHSLFHKHAGSLQRTAEQDGSNDESAIPEN